MLALTLLVAVVPSGAQPRPGATPKPKKAPVDKASTMAMKSTVPAKVFPYTIHKRTLPNGLDVLIVETPEFKNVLSYNTLVLAGARNELEKGKTGLAHLFEHILFRHALNGQPGGYQDAMERLGAHNNAWTWFDVTFFHPLTFASNLTGRTVGSGRLPGVLDLEASRFMSLSFDEKIFKTETGAVLGEYRNGSSVPTLKMSERLLALAFPNHPYGHDTIGYYEDVLAMPNHYEAAREFYDTYYRPNNCVLLIVGDVKTDEVYAQVKARYRDWQSKPTPPLPAPAPLGGPKREAVQWPADVAPQLFLAYGMPRFHTGTAETAVGQLLSELLVSRSAPLYRRLRFEKQTASDLAFAEGTQGFESFDPRLLTFDVQLVKEQYVQKGSAYFDEVIRDVEEAVENLKHFSRDKGSAQTLATLKSKYRNDFLTVMASPAQIAYNLAWYYRFERDPEVFEKLVTSVERLEPKDIDAFAQKYFVPGNQVMVTLTHEKSGATQ